LITRLRKQPDVRRALNSNWQLDKKSKGGGDSIFDDFFGGGGNESEEEEEEEEKPEITVNEAIILENAALEACRNGQGVLALLLIEEN